MQVVHVNVRLEEGGAAKVALDLHLRGLRDGINSLLFYGYGKGAAGSEGEVNYDGVARLSSRIRVVGNYALHRALGLELLPPKAPIAARFSDVVRHSDVVHLHAIHSFFFPLNWALPILQRARAIVWTCHDFWPLTGRCASIENCDGWTFGCGVCPTRKNYPPTFFDLSAYQFRRRRHALRELRRKIVFVAPSEYVREKYQAALPDFNVIKIYNGMDLAFEELAKEPAPVINDRQYLGIRVLVIANDLSDPLKVNVGLVRSILTGSNIELHTVGSKSPFVGPAIVNHGPINSRMDLLRIYRMVDVLLFLSSKDTFGLVIIESLSAGLPVIALRSAAASEILGAVGQPTFNEAEIREVFSTQEKLSEKISLLRAGLSALPIRKFSGCEMFRQYKSLYLELTAR
jgi:putative colanic acid biosynthesis glycosyltransferase